MTISVAHVNVAKDYRGGERQTELLIRELAQRGVRQVLVCRRGAPLGDRVADAAVEVRLVSGNPFAVALATGGVDVVHVHEGRSVYGAWLRRRVAGTPYIVTRRVDNPIGDHRLAHKAWCGAAFVAAVAPQVADLLRRYDGRIEPCVIHSAGSALPVDAARAAAIRAQHEGKFLVGHVGALDNRQKGQEFIIALARDLEHEEPSLHFMLVGGGADEKMLKDAAAGLSNVTFTGFVDNVGDYLAAFDLFVLPSHREGIGSILLDAMERGLPIVASRVGGVPAIVCHGDNGLLVEAARTDELKAAILQLRDSPDVRRRFGDRGREVAKRYTARRMGERYLELYEAAARRRMPSP